MRRGPDECFAGDIAPVGEREALGWCFALDARGDSGVETHAFVDDAIEVRAVCNVVGVKERLSRFNIVYDFTEFGLCVGISA